MCTCTCLCVCEHAHILKVGEFGEEWKLNVYIFFLQIVNLQQQREQSYHEKLKSWCWYLKMSHFTNPFLESLKVLNNNTFLRYSLIIHAKNMIKELLK